MKMTDTRNTTIEVKKILSSKNIQASEIDALTNEGYDLVAIELNHRKVFGGYIPDFWN